MLSFPVRTTRTLLGASLIALCWSVSPGRAADPAPTCQADASAPVRAKRRFGLGSLLSAARQAGVGDMLTGRTDRLLGAGKGGAIAGAVAGTAIQAAEQGEAGPESPLAGLAGSHRGAQIAGAVTGMVIQAAEAGAAPECASG